MRVCFSVGSMSSRLISSISKSADNVEFSSYSSIADMIKESTMRHIFFDRIVFSEKILTDSESELQALSNYIAEFSDNTKIVLICQGKDMENPRIFSSLFESPLYTVALVEKVTTKTLVEFVTSDIVELKAKYYSLDIKETKAVTSKYSHGEIGGKETLGGNSEKKGFFKSLFSNKKNVNLKVENQNSNLDTFSDEGKYGESVSKTPLESGSESPISDIAIPGVVGASIAVAKNEVGSVGNFIRHAPGSVGGSDFGNENHCNDFNDILGIGDLGEQHTDTGFLDEGAENEIEEELRNLETGSSLGERYNEEVTPVLENYAKEIDYPLSSKTSYVSEEILHPIGSISNEPKYRLVIGERGVGVTSYIIDYSANQAVKGKKVLIVDLDIISNGVLSYIDSDVFYSKGRSNGIEDLLVYTEDSVDILSNGYGISVTKDSIVRLMNSRLFDSYDIVFIDCPLDCIEILNKELVSKCVAMIKVNGNRGSLIALIDKLTSRKHLSPEIEDILFQNSKFDILDKLEYYDEDIAFIRRLCFFSRGDWLSKIG